MAPLTTPKPADLDAQAARLREQAAGLGRRQADREEAVRTDHGTRFDDALRASAEARAAANEATERANDMHRRAQQQLEEAKRHETEAEASAMSSDPAERAKADDERELAQLARASATSATQRAQHSERVARQRMDEVEQADRQAVQIQRAHDDAIVPLHDMWQAANKLEDKATLLERAADELRAADGPIDPDRRPERLAKARQAIAEAEATKPDFSRIDPRDIVAAGIPMTEVPGAELMQPQAMTAPAGSRPIDDTALMRPDEVDPVNPVNPVVPGPVIRSNDTDLMHPDAVDPVLGPGSPDGDSTSLMDPSAPSSPSGEGAGMVDPLDQAQAEPVPFGETPSAGDLGLPPVDAPAASAEAAGAPSSDGEAASVDLPDVATTIPDGDAYGDTYGDADGSSPDDTAW